MEEENYNQNEDNVLLEEINENIPNSYNESNLSNNQGVSTNEEIVNLFRQVLSLRQPSSPHSHIRNELIEFEEYYYEFVTSNKFFLFSFFMLIPLFSYLGLEIIKIIKKQEDISIRILESEQMWIFYGLLTVILTILTWNFYLLIFKISSGFSENIISYLKLRDLMEVSSADVLYFNPFYFNILVFHYNKIYICTNFDLFSIMIITSQYLINFFYANVVYNFYKIKISKITNLHLLQNRILIYRMRILFLFLIMMNLVTSNFTQYLTSEADFYFIYLMQHKSIYLTLKVAGMWYENETSFKQLDNTYATNEQYYLNSVFIRMVFQMVNMVLIVQILLFGNVLFFSRGTYVFFVPCSFIFLKTVFGFFKIFKSYEEIKTFFDRMENVFPLETLTNKDIECSICTEILTKARKLTCNHYFHLICLSKWIEKGKRNCPLCRKEIQENVGSLNRSNTDEYVFRFSLSSRLFNWLPNLTIRLGRVSNNSNFDENINSQ